MEEVEPPTTARIVMHTTCGPLEMELWGVECPRSVRAFLQLCLEGYYEGTPVHRCLPGYLVQGGDPTGTGEGGEAPGGPLPLESHPRLHWTRRGLVGLAPAEGTGLAGSQFFITLAPTPELDRKATLIGRLVGQTIYNLVRMGEAPRVPGSERFAEPMPRITSVSVVENPWDDIIPRELAEVQTRRQAVLNAKQTLSPPLPSPRPGKRPPPLTRTGRVALSFAAEEDADAGAGTNVPRKEAQGRIRSSHEILHNDPSLSRHSVTVTRETGGARDGPGDRPNDGSPHGGGIGDGADAGSTGRTLAQLQEERRARIDQTARKIAQVREELRAMRTVTAVGEGTAGAGPQGSSMVSPPGQQQDSLGKFLGIRKRALAPATGLAGAVAAGSGSPPSKMYKERKRLIVGQPRRTAMDEMDTLLALNAFRDKLTRMEDPLGPGAARREQTAEPEPLATQLDICKLHGLVNCQSCRDTFGQGEMAGPEAEEGWLMHRLIFDREAGYRELRTDLDQLQVIDPRTRTGAEGTHKKDRVGGT